MRLRPQNRAKLVDAAAGRIPCDLVIKNANMVNVFTKEVYPADIGIHGGFIAHIHSDPDGLQREEAELVGTKTYDAKGAYLIPGFIDSHIHIESTWMTPRYFAKAVIPHGTTTVVTDPHEIGNVLGVEGVRYMHECSKDLPMRQYILAPSCVPSVPGKENGGAVFGVEEVSELLELERVIGLAEVMDYYGVINNNQRMLDIVGLAYEKDMFIQGHAFYIHGRELSAYACAGPQSDHECVGAQDARDRIRIGINVDARESSISQDVMDIVSGARDFQYCDNITFATDDTESDDIHRRGHENYIVQQAIKAGMDPIDAIRIATINGAREVGIQNLGAIAPGYVADLLVVESLENLTPKAVFFEGALVAENGKLTADIPDAAYEIEVRNTVKLPDLTEESFKIKAPANKATAKCNIICFDPEKSFMTDFSVEELPVKDGYLDISHDPDLKFATVVNRYGKNTIGQAIVRGYGIQKGGVGSTVAHDCHNIILIYDTPENAMCMAKDLAQTGGGYVCAENGSVFERIELPVAGLMANRSIDAVAKQSSDFKKALAHLGLKDVEFPMFIMAILPLPVVPVARLTDLGMVNAITQEIVDLFL